MLLTSAVASVLKELSQIGPVAYVETDYHGGTGVQDAMAWSGGNVVYPAESSEYGPINAALAAIGVKRLNNLDEFDSAELGQFRSSDALYAQ